MKYEAGMPCWVVGAPEALARANGRVVVLGERVNHDTWKFRQPLVIEYGPLTVAINAVRERHLMPMIQPSPPVLADIPKAVKA